MLKSLAVPLLALLVWCLAVGLTNRESGPGVYGPLPDFATIDDVREKKARFFDYLAPAVAAENKKIREQRERLERVHDALRSGDAPGRSDKRFLEGLAEEYRVTTDEGDWLAMTELLLARVDVIPPRLALIQAAKESGWGTSRFARSANNLFGEWCYSAGCGVVPASRSPGKTHEVQAFDSVQDAVASYVRNINTSHHYEGLREQRAALRQSGQAPSAIELADGLGRYSERGDAYVQEVKSMIRQNEPFLDASL